jgi:peptidoglycan hydrolase-like protein with peptidoglycan-binding domain
VLNQVIRKGSSREALTAVQGQLAWWGLYPRAEIDGVWGPKTEAAVRQLQTNLSGAGFDPGAADGVWGPKTYVAYKAWIKSAADAKPAPAPSPAPAPAPAIGNFKHWAGQVLSAKSPYPSGGHVAEVQFLLNVVYGADRKRWVAVDGVYGPSTKASVQTFQRVYNVFFDPNISEDGVFGPATAKALDRVLRRKGVW